MRAVRPRVSVLLPVHDAQATLPLCLASVARQTERALECIVVDDGSTDDSPAIAERFARADPRFRVIARPHRGLVAALQAGIEACRAPAVARMDADDVMHRERLGAELGALAANPTLSAVGCHVRIFPRSGLRAGRRRYERWLNAIGSADDVAREAFIECPLAHPTLCIRAEALAAFGYRDCGWPEDYDLVLRLLGAGKRLAVVPRRLLAWRDGPTRLSRTDPRYAAERFAACRAHHLAAGFLARTDRYVLWGYGDTGKLLRRTLAVHDKRPAAIVELHPGRIGQRIHGAEVITPAALGPPGALPLLVSVAGPVARAEIRAALARLGWRELEHYRVCA